MNFGLTKRQKIVIASIIVALGLISTQLVPFSLRFRSIVFLAGVSAVLGLWALWEGLIDPQKKSGSFLALHKTKTLVVLILPIFFTLAVSTFYFLLPVRWLTRLPVAFLFGLLFYLLLLAQNVFSVAAIRTIPLYRAASTAAFLFTLFSAFFIYNVIHAMELAFYWNGLLVFILSFPLVLQILWSINMEDDVSIGVIVQSLILSLCLGELALVFSFWPLGTVIWSLTLSSAMYVLLGITTLLLRGKSNRRILVEYIVIGVVVFLVSFLTTSWTG